MVARTRLNITFILTLPVLLFIECYGLFNVDINILDYVSLEGRISNKWLIINLRSCCICLVDSVENKIMCFVFLYNDL